LQKMNSLPQNCFLAKIYPITAPSNIWLRTGITVITNELKIHLKKSPCEKIKLKLTNDGSVGSKEIGSNKPARISLNDAITIMINGTIKIIPSTTNTTYDINFCFCIFLPPYLFY